MENIYLNHDNTQLQSLFQKNTRDPKGTKPITLLNIDYKIYVTVIAELKKPLPHIIHE